MAVSLEPDHVLAIYQSILRRSPENELVVFDQIQKYRTLDRLIQAVLDSPEYQSADRRHDKGVANIYRSEPQVIEIDVVEALLQRLFDRVHRQWDKLGKQEPYWSVLTDSQYRMSNIAEHKESFYKSGAFDANLIDIFARRSGVTVPRGVCLELGCGVGRITQFLANQFEKVIALDVSNGNLALCRDLLQSKCINNVNLHEIRQMQHFEFLPECDFFFSIIVLQHNPPPVQKYIIECILSKLRKGGFCLFQTPASLVGYSFKLEDYLLSDEPTIKMHALPMAQCARQLSQIWGACKRGSSRRLDRESRFIHLFRLKVGHHGKERCSPSLSVAPGTNP